MSADTEPTDAEAQRLQALAGYRVLDTPPEASFDDITELAARVFGVPLAAVSLIDADRQWFKSRVGLELTQTPRTTAICDHAIRQSGVLVVPDLQRDARFQANPFVRGADGLRFYAGAPLRTPEGHAVGTLCVMDHAPRSFSDAQADALAVLSRQVVAQLELRKQNAALADAMAQLQAEHALLRSAQQRLADSETRMGLVLRGANDGWWDWDLVTGERYYSPRGWELLGYQDAELPYDGQLWERLIHPDDQPHVDRVYLSAIRSGVEHYAAEMRLRHKDGHYIPMLSRGYILRNDQGRALRLSGTNTDLSELRRAEQARVDVQTNYEALFTNSMDGVLQTDPQGRVIAANPAACTLLGLAHDDLLDSHRDALIDLDDTRLPPLLDRRARHGSARGELRLRRASGEVFEAEVTSSVFNDRLGRPLTSVVFRDNTERHSWARRLEASLALLHNLAEHVPGVLYQFQLRPDGSSCFPFASQGLWQIYERTPDEVLHDAGPIFARLHPDDAQAVSDAIGESARTLQRWRQEYRVVLPVQGTCWRQGDAQPEQLADGSVLWHGFISDITARKQAEAETHRLAYFDALTGLPNRRLLHDRIGHALAAAQRAGCMGALVFIDLDNFKQINDARGHSVGDALLQQVAQRLSALLRSEDTVARLGGDEFVVLLGNLGADADAAARHAMSVADKVRDVLAQPFQIGGALYGSSGSLGITLFPKGQEHVDDLLREADTAMYRAKAAGRNRIAFFEAGMQVEVEERLALEQDMQQGLADGQFQVHVQPQVDASGHEVGAELLLRWQHPRRGSVSPAAFIPIAEESGLILALGAFVIDQACQALARLHAAGSALTLSVNVSPRQFRQDHFVEQVRAALQASGAPASQLVLEVTEGLLIDHWEDTVARMRELVALGVRFSIDDFGTGYSSLSYLRRMPLYELKIDRSFVRDTPHDANATAIVEAVLSVAAHLGLRVVAEGVETQAQADFLAASHCDVLQGYLFARPQPLAPWLEAHEVVPGPLRAARAGARTDAEEPVRV